jgi:hypothetical protein
MKLRLRGGSLRLRLGQAEVSSLVADGRVEERVPFGPGGVLVYAIKSDDRATAIEAQLSQVAGGPRIEVVVPRARAASWAASEDVGLEASQPIEGSDPLKILVEKDFACLKPRAGEGDEDAFPHPGAASAKNA